LKFIIAAATSAAFIAAPLTAMAQTPAPATQPVGDAMNLLPVVQWVESYREAIKLDPNFARAFYNRSVAKLKIGDTAGSDADLAQAKELQKDIGAE
jgi:TPR repeat